MASGTSRQTSRWAGLALLAAVAFAACADTGTVVTGVVHPTLIELSPSEFMQGVPCLDAPGAMRSYVATIWDIGLAPPDQVPGEGGSAPVEPPFALPSSGPVACTQPVGFARVVPLHRYVADIEGYDRPGLVPLAPGSRVMVEEATGARIAPRWTSHCGGEDGTIAHEQLGRTIRGCTPLVDARPSELTAVEVRIDTVLGSLTCGDEPGQVARFEVEVSAGERLGADCGDAVVIPGLAADTNLRLPVFAYEADAEEPGWGTTCTARVAAGALVPASCTTLTDRGGVDVSPTALLAAYGLDCSALGELFVENPLDADDVRPVGSTECAANIRFSGIPRGPTEVSARLVDSSGADLGVAFCSAEVIPNQAVPADACALEP